MTTTYAVLTPPGQVDTLNEVQVAVIDTRQDRQITSLAFLDSELARHQAKLDSLLAQIATLTETRAKVLATVENVTLRRPPQPLSPHP